MANNGITEKSRIGMPLFMAITLIASAISGTVAALSAAYGFRQAAWDRIEQRVTESAIRTRSERAEALAHYLTLEQFYEWRQQDRIRQDAQNYSVLNALDRLRINLEARRK